MTSSTDRPLCTWRVLVQGRARRIAPDIWYAVPTVTLVRCGDYTIVVDPGGKAAELQDALKDAKIDPYQVTHIFLTHGHLDHCNLIGMFPHANFLDGSSSYDTGISAIRHEEQWLPFASNPNLKIVKTPGHCADHASLLLNTFEDGVVCVAGDLFWWTEDEEECRVKSAEWREVPDDGATNFEQLQRSRRQVLDVAHIIIPGHGTVKENRYGEN